jgi:hypothetical protein
MELFHWMLSRGELKLADLKLKHSFSSLGSNASIVLWETMLLQVRVGPTPLMSSSR